MFSVQRHGRWLPRASIRSFAHFQTSAHQPSDRNRTGEPPVSVFVLSRQGLIGFGTPFLPCQRPLPLKTEFYFLVDKDRKLFPRIKISDTSARTVPTPGNPNVTTSPVPADTQVIAKKANADGKDDQKGQGDKKKKS